MLAEILAAAAVAYLFAGWVMAKHTEMRGRDFIVTTFLWLPMLVLVAVLVRLRRL